MMNYKIVINDSSIYSYIRVFHIAAAVAAGIVEAAEIDFYAFASQDINFTCPERVIFANLSGW